jgi:hypothetical protein
MTDGSRWGDQASAVVVVALLLTVGVVPTGAGTSVAAETDSQSLDTPGPEPQSQVTTPGNNSTATRHQNPDAKTENGDLTRVSNHLAGLLSRQLQDSTIQISQGEYELAREAVGPEYRERFGQYVDVAGRTDTQEDDQIASRFEQTATEQRNLADTLSEFDKTRNAYLEAKQRGNTTRARELAHRLEQLSAEMRSSRDELVRNYRTIENRTDVTLRDKRTVLNETVDNFTSQVQAIQSVEFNATTLTVTALSETGSFRDPIEFEGRLESNGTAIADRTVRLIVDDREILTETDDDGRFTASFRPVNTGTGSQTVRVRYAPTGDSRYQVATDSLTTQVVQVDPEVTARVEPGQAGFRDNISIEGVVSSDDVAVPDAPVSVYLDNQLITTTTTRENGTFDVRTRVPFSLPSGSQSVRVVVGAAENAIGRTEASPTFTVEATDPTLTLVASRLSENGTDRERRTVITEGRLTAAGESIPNQRIELVVGGTVVGTVRTDSEGRYNTTVLIPADQMPRSVGAESRIVLSASYAGNETNLAPGTDDSSVLVQAQLLDIIERNLSISNNVLAFAVLGLTIVARRRYDQSSQEARSDSSNQVQRDSSDTTVDTSSGPSLLTLSDRALDSDRPDAAILFAYASVRTRIADELNISPNVTPWEFLSACRTAGMDEAPLERLNRLTSLYETAAFGPQSAEIQSAALAHDLAESVRIEMAAESDQPTVDTDSTDEAMSPDLPRGEHDN